MENDTLDRAALRTKYREERDKRIRPDGNEQYGEPTGRFASLLDDPYVTPVPRDPCHDEVTVAIIRNSTDLSSRPRSSSMCSPKVMRASGSSPFPPPLLPA
jgi:hypothetical protein